MGSNQSSQHQTHSHWDDLDKRNFQAYIERHGDGEPIIFGKYNEWLNQHGQRTLSVDEFNSMTKPWNTKAAAKAKAAATAEAKAKRAADAKAEAEKKRNIQKFGKEEGDLEERAIVYFRSYPDPENTKIHYYNPVTMDYKERVIPKWTKYRLIDFYPFQETSTHKFDEHNKCFVELQEVKQSRKTILLTWKHFIDNFTPFNEEDSKPNTHGQYFKPEHWHFDENCIRTKRTHYTPKKGRDSSQSQSRQSPLRDGDEKSWYVDDPR